MMPLVRDRKTRLEKQLAQVKARLQALDARQATAERKARDRRHFIIGEALLAHAETEPVFRKWLALHLDSVLSKPRDRAMFDEWFAELVAAAAPPDRRSPLQRLAAAFTRRQPPPSPDRLAADRHDDGA